MIVKLFARYLFSLRNSCRSCVIELWAPSDGSRTWSAFCPSAGGGCLEHVDIYFLYCEFFIVQLQTAMASLSVRVWTMSWDSQKTCWDIVYFTSLDTLTKPQWEAAVRGWGLA